MKADGSGLQQITNFGPEGGATQPSWSPDGSRIAYQVCTNCELGGGNYEISVVEVTGTAYDTSQIHAVTDHPASDTNPIWSPDDSRIGFVSGRDYVDADTLWFRRDLYVMDADGSNRQRVTESGGYIWMNKDELIQTVTDRNTNMKEVFIRHVVTGTTIPLMKDLDVKNQFWVSWDPGNQQLLTINKNHEELPVVVASYTLDGEVQHKYQLNSGQLRTAFGFDWHIE